MKGLNEESIAQIDDIDKLRYLLTGVTQKNAKQLKRVRVLQRQLKNAKAEVRTLSEKLTRLKIERESDSMFRWERDFEKIRADFNEFAFSEVFRLIQEPHADNSAFFKEQIQKYQQEFQKTKSSESYEQRNIIAAKNDEIQTLKTRLEELSDKVEAQEAAPISKDIEKAILEKDQSILKLRTMIQKFVKSDQAKQQQIEDQQREIQRLVTAMNVPMIAREGSVEEVARLEREIEHLKTQLTQSQASEQLEQKCEKLTAMLDTSNELYAELKSKYKALVDSTKPRVLSVSECHFTERSSRKAHAHEKSGHSSEVEELQAMLASLRKTILQYFLTDLTNQENLIPVILELVGCTKEQIQAATSKFKSNQQFVNRAGAFLGLFT